jgi:hypothetical protein
MFGFQRKKSAKETKRQFSFFLKIEKYVSYVGICGDLGSIRNDEHQKCGLSH